MAITDLTGYIWVGNSSLTITTQDNATYNINGEGHFLDNQGQFNGTFTSISISEGEIGDVPPIMKCDSSIVYVGSWNGQEPFTIQITGGTDATNSDLISWLEANGTLIPPIENKKGMYVGGNKVSKVMVGDKAAKKILIGDKVIYEVEPQGETWVIDESPVFTQTFTYQVNFESNSKQYSAFACVQLARPDVLKYGDDLVYAGTSWTDEAHRTVTFETEPTGDLLTWLQANAVKQ